MTEKAIPFWVNQVQEAGAFLVANLAAHEAAFLVQKGTTRIQVDVNGYEPLGEDTIQKMAALSLYLVRDEPVTAAIRRLTFQVGGDPPSTPTSWGASRVKEDPR